MLHLHIHAFVKIQSDIKVQTQFQNSKLRQGSVKQMHIAWGGGEADKAANCILLIGLSEHYLLLKKRKRKEEKNGWHF